MRIRHRTNHLLDERRLVSQSGLLPGGRCRRRDLGRDGTRCEPDPQTVGRPLSAGGKAFLRSYSRPFGPNRTARFGSDRRVAALSDGERDSFAVIDTRQGLVNNSIEQIWETAQVICGSGPNWDSCESPCAI